MASSASLTSSPLKASDELPVRSLLSAIIQSSDDAIFSYSLDGRIMIWNPAAERLFGYRAEEVLGQPVARLAGEDERVFGAVQIEALKSKEQVDAYEASARRKDGSVVPVSLKFSLVRNDENELVGVSAVARDISREKKAVEATQLLAAVVESSDDGIVAKDLTGTITSWNTAAERIFGYTAAEIVGQSVLKLIPPHLHSDEPIILARLQRGERIANFATVRLRKDGQPFDASLTISPVRNDRGVTVGAATMVRDITHQRRSDEATRLLAAIVDSSDDAIISKNLEGIITSWNSGAQRIFGYCAAETIGRPVAMLFPPERINEEPTILERLKRGERVDHYQTVRVRKDGTRIDVSLTISPVKNAQGIIVGASKIARDITREIHAVAQLARANEELRRADRMKSEFLAVMSHELRTPLNSIIGFASVLRSGRAGAVTEEQQKQLHLIHSSGKHLLQLINDLLDLSRIEAGRMEAEPEMFSLRDVFEEAVRLLEIQATQKNLQLHHSVEGNDQLFTDRKRVFQIVVNLLGNAIKFTPAGSVALKATREANKVIVTVTDTGIGIPADKQASLFQAFSQVEGSARRRYEGTGLGLYLCRKLAALLGGEISVRSQPNRGSTFTVILPAHLSLKPVAVADKALTQ